MAAQARHVAQKQEAAPGVMSICRALLQAAAPAGTSGFCHRLETTQDQPRARQGRRPATAGVRDHPGL
ncbi:hypothetical protein NDU88_001834 [Pleurodeles waltl]|uniref:Uncharacterized protein n=1 Tax=Pleurodeles waltl TaxID=8319 RepID=A0AAV7KQL5_PLEWA|nr:hypothetical protein NDU88_001834 [Pleurodeles waltl]